MRVLFDSWWQPAAGIIAQALRNCALHILCWWWMMYAVALDAAWNEYDNRIWNDVPSDSANTYTNVKRRICELVVPGNKYDLIVDFLKN